MPLMLIIIFGWSSDKPFWARRLGSIPSTLKTFLVAAGIVVAASVLSVVAVIAKGTFE